MGCIVPATENDFQHVLKQIGMSESATPTTQNDIPTWFDTQKRTSFAASPINTATPHENHRLETRHVEASKRAFRKDFLQFHTL